jgi:hypothetical protein
MTPKLGVIILVYKLVYFELQPRLKWIQIFIPGWVKMVQAKHVYKLNHPIDSISKIGRPLSCNKKELLPQ